MLANHDACHSGRFHHPADKNDILALLAAVGPVACYGLRSVEFVRQPRDHRSEMLRFGRYQPLGRILLFEQPPSPWRLPGQLHRDDAARYQRAGALIIRLTGSQATLVEWPPGTLKRFR